jgi:hypothetical protein
MNTGLSAESRGSQGGNSYHLMVGREFVLGVSLHIWLCVEMYTNADHRTDRIISHRIGRICDCEAGSEIWGY